VDLTSENLFNKPVTLWRALLDDNLAMIDTPNLLFKGKINTANLVLNDPQKGNYYEIEVESRLRQAPKALYFDRQTLWTAYQHSGDTFFDQLVNIPNFKGEWGKAPTYYGAVPLPPGSPGPGGNPSPPTKPR